MSVRRVRKLCVCSVSLLIINPVIIMSVKLQLVMHLFIKTTPTKKNKKKNK